MTLDDDASLSPSVQRAGEPIEDSLAGEHGVEWGEDMHVLLEAAMRKPDANLREPCSLLDARAGRR